MMKKSGQARQLEEKLSNSAKEQRIVLNMVTLKEVEQARELAWELDKE